MEVVLDKVSKSFGKQHVVSDVDFTFAPGGRHAILGGNGSGKSTLLKMIYGALTPSSGILRHYIDGNTLKPDEAVFQISLASPYLELIEELSAIEFLRFYSKFRSYREGVSPHDILEYCMLGDSSKKEIRNYSSGMKQRLRLGLALFSQSRLVLLDEPVSNLDPTGIQWYQQLIDEHLSGRTLIVGSNFDEREMGFCSSKLRIQIDHKV